MFQELNRSTLGAKRSGVTRRYQFWAGVVTLAGSPGWASWAVPLVRALDVLKFAKSLSPLFFVLP